MDAVLLEEYVARHNRGLSSGDLSAMLELFHLDAEMHFVGLRHDMQRSREPSETASSALHCVSLSATVCSTVEGRPRQPRLRCTA